MSPDTKETIAFGIPFMLALTIFPFIVLPVITIAIFGTAIWKWLEENL